MEEKPINKGLRLVYVVTTAVMFAVFFSYLFSVNMNMNLNDPDVWWHLKMGEYVLEHHEVPDQDPFAFTSPVPLDRVQLIGLRAHWLGQVIFSLANKAEGLLGVVLLRNTLIIMPMIILLLWLLRRKVNPWESFIVLALPALMLCLQLFYSFERPQGFSFNLVLFTVILLERVRSKSHEARFDHAYWLLPVIIAIWANIHAGYIVGNIIIVIYMASVIARAMALSAWDSIYVRSRGLSLSAVLDVDFWKGLARASYSEVMGPYRRFYIVTVIALLASGLNPNGYFIFANYATGLLSMFIKDVARYATGGAAGWVQNVVLEYKPLYYFYFNLEYTWLVFYWAFSAMVVGVLLAKYWIRRSVDLAEFATVFFVVLFANMYARGIMFSLTVMPLYLAKSLIELKEGGEKLKVPVKATIAFAAIIFLSFATYSYKRTPQALKRGVPVTIRHKVCLMTSTDKAACEQLLASVKAAAQRPDRYVTLWYPTVLSKFILAYRPDPPMYNYYTWGGYLIYSLYPNYRVFIDGRALDNRMTTTADQILKAFPSWKSSMDGGFRINFAAIPVIFRESGHIIPLAPALANDYDWSLAFLKNNSALFLRTRSIGSSTLRSGWDYEAVSPSIQKNRDIIKRVEQDVLSGIPALRNMGIDPKVGGLDKRNVYREIIQLENMFLRGSPTNATFNMSKADALRMLGQYREALSIYERFPTHPASKHGIMRLRQVLGR